MNNENNYVFTDERIGFGDILFISILSPI